MYQRNKTKNLMVVFTLLAALTACDAISGRETAGEYVDDSAITAQVKTSIIDELGLKQINVETMQNVVQLSGFVDSSTIKYRAGEIAAGVSGVTEVSNDLVVR
ncbi:MAG: BON domain-containing protein [Rhodospirillales bacterium]